MRVPEWKRGVLNQKSDLVGFPGKDLSGNIHRPRFGNILHRHTVDEHPGLFPDRVELQEKAAAAPGFRDRKRSAIPPLRIIRNREASDLRNVRFFAVEQMEIAAIPAPRHFHIDPVSIRPDRIRHCRLLAVALQQFGDRGLRIDLELPVIVQRNRMTNRRIFLKMIFPFPVHPFRQSIGGKRPFDRFPPGERRRKSFPPLRALRRRIRRGGAENGFLHSPLLKRNLVQIELRVFFCRIAQLHSDCELKIGHIPEIQGGRIFLSRTQIVEIADPENLFHPVLIITGQHGRGFPAFAVPAPGVLFPVGDQHDKISGSAISPIGHGDPVIPLCDIPERRSRKLKSSAFRLSDAAQRDPQSLPGVFPHHLRLGVSIGVERLEPSRRRDRMRFKPRQRNSRQKRQENKPLLHLNISLILIILYFNTTGKRSGVAEWNGFHQNRAANRMRHVHPRTGSSLRCFRAGTGNPRADPAEFPEKSSNEWCSSRMCVLFLPRR